MQPYRLGGEMAGPIKSPAHPPPSPPPPPPTLPSYSDAGFPKKDARFSKIKIISDLLSDDKEDKIM